MALLSVKGLTKSFRSGFWRTKSPVLFGIDFSIEAGSITGFLGANGAGKTTTLKCLLNLIHPDGGQIEFFGEPGLPIEARKRVGFLPEHPYFYDYLTGREFLAFYGKLSGVGPKHELDLRIEEMLGRVNMTHAGDKALRDYSKGMLQKIGVAQALIHRPDFVILDEPMSGLDPDGRADVRDIIGEIASGGTAVFFSSHLLHDAETLCSDLVVLKKGQVVYNGQIGSLLERFEGKKVVTYVENDDVSEKTVATDGELNEAIDSLRSSGKRILEISRQKQSLEQVFVEVAFDGDRQK